MREIKFRGWDEENKCWHDGWYSRLQEGARKFDAIIREEDGMLVRYYIHDAKTIGQYTGLKDMNGKDIYEGDIMKWDGSNVGSVSFDNAEYIVGSGVNARAMCVMPHDEVKIIGNIHENPELLK